MNCMTKTIPVAFINEHGNIVIVGYDAWNKTSFVDADRAFPDSWTRLVPDTPKGEVITTQEYRMFVV